MKKAQAQLKSVCPYYQCRPLDQRDPQIAKKEKETCEDYEDRIWRERLHYGTDGQVFIPASSFKNCLSEAAKYLNLQIPGKGKATYTKHFEAGILVPESLPISATKDNAKCHRLFLPADGKRGSGKRVWKNMPIIHEWSGTVEFLILDETITKDVFRKVLEEAGKFIGIGTFRPRNNGTFGRFEVADIKWI